MDPLSFKASIDAILPFSADVVANLNDANDAPPEDFAQCAIEAANLHGFLLTLRGPLEKGASNQPWYTAVRALVVENGPFDKFKQALETLQTVTIDRGPLKKAGKELAWKAKKE
jgi:uncharacterized protein YgfB (UPF0149 family)